MKDEIKEINITFPGQILDYVDTKEHLLELFNYITNFQERFDALLEAHKIADELETEYQERNEKAIEYIKTTSFFNKSHYDFKNDLLNILGGDDNE